ncbi:MAG: 30S ribosomal protein S20 [Chloroflexi bacterium]|nr:30S ribosomal protein S20 [Chloroflexota bacterium]
MANTQSAQKRIRSNARKALRNKVRKSRVRTAVKGARDSLDEANAAEARKAVLAAVSELDKAAETGVIHKNNAARRKGRLMKKLAALEAKK